MKRNYKPSVLDFLGRFKPTGEPYSYSEVAREVGCSRAWVSFMSKDVEKRGERQKKIKQVRRGLLALSLEVRAYDPVSQNMLRMRKDFPVQRLQVPKADVGVLRRRLAEAITEWKL